MTRLGFCTRLRELLDSFLCAIVYVAAFCSCQECLDKVGARCVKIQTIREAIELQLIEPAKVQDTSQRVCRDLLKIKRDLCHQCRQIPTRCCLDAIALNNHSSKSGLRQVAITLGASHYFCP